MRLFILFFILMLPGFSEGSGYYRAMGVDKIAAYKTLELCQKDASDKVGFKGCFPISDCPRDPRACSLKDVQVPDREQEPSQVVTDEQACADKAECQSLIAQDGYCTEDSYSALYGDRDEDGSMEAWCVHNEYPTKTVTRLEPDQDKIDALEAERQARQEKQAKVQAKQAAIKKGQEIIMEFMLLNDERGLSSAQRAQLLKMQEIQDAKLLLETGNLEAARDVIDSMTPDGTLLTGEVQSQVLGMIDARL